jgi:mannose-1-phosphate guanylyltransferase / mannose-6-phosphate isomerase
MTKPETTPIANRPPVDLQVVILAGGSGTRLWPVSREALPKQFVKLFSDKTLLEETVARLPESVSANNITIVTSATAARGEAMVHLAPYKQIHEPCPRNTAPAIALAALQLTLDGGDPVMLVLPSDHAIKDTEGFRTCLEAAAAAASDGALVTFGIVPTYAETGYGYIKTKPTVAPVKAVEVFKEKPDLATARSFIASGGYYWNSGMFVWRASVLLGAIERHLPRLHAVLDAIRNEMKLGASFDAAIAKHFADAEAISIDHGLLEKVAVATGANALTPSLLLIPADIGWSDVGSWDAVRALTDQDAQGNSVSGNVVMHKSSNVTVHAQSRLVAVVGVEDVTIVDTPDAVLVTKHGHAQDVREVVAALAKSTGREHIEHTTIQRPWGSYTLLADTVSHKVKRIVVKPGGRLSLQSHEQRSEHWVVVSGEATVTCGDKVTVMAANESIYIPRSAKHRLENFGQRDVELIEVQVGSYLGEDDIQRYDDQYGRLT